MDKEKKGIGRRSFLKRLGAGAAVGAGRAGGDHIQRISQNVRKDNGKHLGRGAMLGKTAALYGREPLADGVDLGDLRTAGKKLAGNVL